MIKELEKPCDADERIPMFYPREVQEDYAEICENVDEFCAEKIRNLVYDIYKVAYVDGFEDVLYYRDL